MSTVGTITKIATGIVGKAAHAATHPRQSVTAVAGQARGLAATVIGGDQTTSSTTAGAAATEPAAATAPPVASPQRNVEPAER